MPGLLFIFFSLLSKTVVVVPVPHQGLVSIVAVAVANAQPLLQQGKARQSSRGPPPRGAAAIPPPLFFVFGAVGAVLKVDKAVFRGLVLCNARCMSWARSTANASCGSSLE